MTQKELEYGDNSFLPDNSDIQNNNGVSSGQCGDRKDQCLFNSHGRH